MRCENIEIKRMVCWMKGSMLNGMHTALWVESCDYIDTLNVS